MLPILYSYRRCPYAMRARMALKLAEIEVEIREISLREKPVHMLQVSPKGTVPVLVLPDSSVIDESLNIMYWAIKQAVFKPDSQFDCAGLERCSTSLQVNVYGDVRALILTNDNDFKQSLDRYKYPERYIQYNLQQNLQQSRLQYRQQGEAFLLQLEALLQKNTYLCNPKMSFADIAIFPFVRQFAAVDNDWFNASPYPNLKNWLNTLLDSALFKSVMEKQPTYFA